MLQVWIWDTPLFRHRLVLGQQYLGQLGSGSARPCPGTKVELIITPTVVVAPFDE